MQIAMFIWKYYFFPPIFANRITNSKKHYESNITH